MTLQHLGLVILAAALAQAQSAQKVNYSTTNYLKVTPAQEAAFLDNSRSMAPKIIQEAIAQGVNITRWTMSRMVYHGNPAQEFNYAATTVYDGTPPEENPALRDQIYRKATGMSFADYQVKLATMRTWVGDTLFRNEETAPASELKEGYYTRTLALKIEPNKAADLMDLLKTMALPLAVQNIKDGRSLGFSVRRVVLPSGPQVAFDVVVQGTFKDLASALAPGGDAAANFAKVHPGKNYTQYIDHQRSMAKLVRNNLFRTVVLVDRPARR